MAENRDNIIDVTRGFAMILVVLGHALYGKFNAGFDSAGTHFLLLILYATHMAAFFEISGMLSGGVVRRDWPDFWRTMLSRLVWPYILWSLFLSSVYFAMRDFTNADQEGFAPWRLIWEPPSVMWFLYVLFFGFVLLRLSVGLPRAAVAALGLGAAAAGYLIPTVPEHTRWVGLFLLAACCGKVALGRLDCRAGYVLAGAVMLATAWMAWTQAQGEMLGYPAHRLRYMPALVAGPLLLYGLSKKVSPLPRVGSGVAYVGRHTMPIFVTHLLCTAGARIALRRLGVDDWTLIVLVGTILGVTLPLTALAVTDRLGVSRLLGWR